jgi:hypothetical protein
MSGPTLSPAQTAQLRQDASNQTAYAATIASSVIAQQAAAARYGVSDSAFQAFFAYYNSIITAYDSERQALNGQYVDVAITESDIINCSNGSGRLVPTSPITDIVRISEFDGTPLLVNPLNESQSIMDQAALENILVNGYGANTYPTTTTTTGTVTSTSTSVAVMDTMAAVVIPLGNAILSDGTNLAVINITSVTNATTMAPYTATLNFTFTVAPSGSVASGEMLTSFTGFTNSERTSKTASTPSLQPLMTYFVSQLTQALNSRITANNLQIAALTTNQDPDAVAEITAAKSSVNAEISFINNYLVATDISNAGLASLASDRTARVSGITARVAKILTNYTGQSKNYFDQRYTMANNRANTARGTLRLQLNALAVAASTQGAAANALASVSAINSLLGS